MTLGVVIGRFQLPELHDAHKKVLEYAMRNSQRLLVLLGSRRSHEFRPTRTNPLSYEARVETLKGHFGANIGTVVFIDQVLDQSEDETWSENIDNIIKKYIKDDNEPVLLFGGRDSFIPHYKGQFPVFKVKEVEGSKSSTEVRDIIKNYKPEHFDTYFREGIVHAVMNRPLCVYPTVDVAVIAATEEQGFSILLGRKEGETKWRLPGGFVDVTDESYEEAALRELAEETGIGAPRPIPAHNFNLKNSIKCLGSGLIDDWRYPPGGDRIMTALFMVSVPKDVPFEASDDLKELKWFSMNHLGDDSLIKGHRPLIAAVRKELEK